MYDFVYLSVRRSVRDSHWSRDYRDGTGIRVFYENPGFYRPSQHETEQQEFFFQSCSTLNVW
jgi:hypothetical protein